MAGEASALPLDSVRWSQLSTRGGVGAGWVRDVLRALGDGSYDSGAFSEMWPELCSEDSTYDAAYAAAPYLVSVAESLSAAEAVDVLIVVGLFETYADQVPGDLEVGYRQALRRALPLTLNCLPDVATGHELRYLLAAVAAFRGRTDLASALHYLDAVQEPCPTCGEVVYPSELQRIIERDNALGQDITSTH